MSEKYTPDEAELIGCYAGAMEEHAGEDYRKVKADAERGIAKIKADAWAEGYRQGIEDERTANEVQMGVGPNRNNPYRWQEAA
ncbi:hypothetical protein [Brevibacterium linens]|uniref:Uncharacterized protein n=1 Tax=Brevibacterium linens TaxID=1703 RepID=A0A0B9AAG0_BRELN|nr:hypothetical protein [Brevibacterium linens]KHS52571.1 hypothetical protein AE0388_1554 [Brevibacterium linens]